MEGKEIIEKENYIFTYYGEKRGRNGIGFLIKKYLKNNILNIITISDRVMRLDIKLNNQIKHIIQVYAQTEDYTTDENEAFYKQITQALENTKNDNDNWRFQLESRKTNSRRH